MDVDFCLNKKREIKVFFSLFFPCVLCVSLLPLQDTHPFSLMVLALSINCTSLFSRHLPFYPQLSSVPSVFWLSPAFLVYCESASVLCVCVWETEKLWQKGAAWGMAEPCRCDGREDGVSRLLLTEAKWCHTVPLSDHLSALLASAQVIKVSCPSCEIKGYITKGQFGSVFNHIYCICITCSLFWPVLAAERITRMPSKSNNNNFL